MNANVIVLGPRNMNPHILSNDIKSRWVDFLNKCPKKAMADKIKNNKQKIRFNHNIFLVNGHNIVVTNVVGTNDFNLIKLSTSNDKLGFPRGFTIIWDLKTIKLYALTTFLSKFQNDDRNDTAFSDKLSDITNVKLAKKFSGSLMMMTSFKLCDAHVLYIGAKNSCHNEYVDEFYNLYLDIKQHQSKEQHDKFIEFLCGRSITFEGCSNNYDEIGMHGALYNESKAVSLIIADNMNNDNIATYWDDEDAMPVFLELGLPVEDRIFANMTNITKFKEWICKLEESRDIMDDILFDNIVSDGTSSNAIKVVTGNFKHSDISNTLEGLIIWLYTSDDVQILKYKFPRYTCMTMCIRTLVESNMLSISKYNTKSVRNAAKNWADRWVIKHDWKLKFIDIIDSVTFQMMVNSGFVALTSKNYLLYADPLMCKALNNDLIINRSDLDLSSQSKPRKLILVIGYVGSGKSLVLKELKNRGYMVVEVDDETSNTPYNIKNKNYRVLKTILFNLSLGKPTAVANGGGLFYNNKKNKMTLLDELAKKSQFPIVVDTIIRPKNNKEYPLKTKEAVISRINRNIYQINDTGHLNSFNTIDEAINIFLGVSKKNYSIQEGLTAWGQKNKVNIVEFTLKNLNVIFSNENLINKLGKEQFGVCNTVKTTYGWHVRVENWIGHVTHGYDKTINETIEFLALNHPTQLTGNKINISEYTAYYVDIGDFKGYDCDTVPHISINAPYPAQYNGQIVQKAVSGDSSIDINIKGSLTKYDLKVDALVKIEVLRPYAYVL